MRVLHVAPTPFGGDGLFGGGERYPLELARALAGFEGVDCELLTFGGAPRAPREQSGLVSASCRPARTVAATRRSRSPRACSAAVGEPTSCTRTICAARPAGITGVLAQLGDVGASSPTTGSAAATGSGCCHVFDRLLAVSATPLAARLPGRQGPRRLRRRGPDRFHPIAAEPRDGVLVRRPADAPQGRGPPDRALPRGACLTIAGTGGHDREPPERDYPQLLRPLARGRDVRFVGAADDATWRRCTGGPPWLLCRRSR